MIKTGSLRQLARMVYFWFLCLTLNIGQKKQRSPLQKWLAAAAGNRVTAVTVAIYGKVFGVGFRSWLRQRARLNQLESLIYYCGPNILGAVLVGSAENIESVVHAAWQGPSRARVYQLKERWFNRPRSSNLEKIKAEPRRFQKTIALLKKTREQLGPLMKRPNRFPVKGKYSNAVALARAAEERCLFVARLGNVNYVVSPRKDLGLQQSQSSRVSSLVRSLTDHKQLTKDYLAARGLPVPAGELFTEFAPAREYLERCGHPLAVKPLKGSYGLGVTVDVRTADELRAAFDYARQYHEQIILEEAISGLDIRVLVIGGRARSALLRIPAHVVGDGKSTVERLILLKNRLRYENPRLSRAPIVPDPGMRRFLTGQGYSLESVPKKGEVIFLRLKANIGAGADSMVITEQLHPDLLRLAEEAAAAFGAVDFWGVDLLVERIDRPRNEQRSVILEVNSRANIFNVQYPLYGAPFDAARSLIDSLFPEESLERAYPFESLEITITGQLSVRFYEYTGKLARKLALRGRIQPAGSIAKAVVYGRKHQLLAFLEGLWGGQKSDWLVDGFRLAPRRGTVEKRFRVVQREGAPASRPGFTAASPRPCFEAPRQIYDFAPEDGIQEAEINTALFLREFARRGYRAEALGEGLLKIKKDNRVGITNIHFSSLFCDKASENIYPLKKILALKGIPVLRGFRFKLSEMGPALNYFEHLGGSSLLTALHPQGNRTVLIGSKSEFVAAWQKAVDRGGRYFIIEEQLLGRNIAVAVVAGQYAGAQLLLPLSLRGDGELTLAQLLEQKNEARLKHPWYRYKPLPAAKYLEQRFEAARCRLDEILPRGEKISLESETVLELGGEAFGLKDCLHRDFEDRAVEAVRAIPGLELAYVHLIVPRPAETASAQPWAVKRIETRPAAAAFHFPWKGERHNLVERIVSELCLSERTRWGEPRPGDVKN